MLSNPGTIDVDETLPPAPPSAARLLLVEDEALFARAVTCCERPRQPAGRFPCVLPGSVRVRAGLPGLEARSKGGARRAGDRARPPHARRRSYPVLIVVVDMHQGGCLPSS
ncbi:hypothetical protein [Methyloversatilis discipulorum]|uniref:hypothetical protein n=1 Tax=Methyloversatilis discipulorum TaxID=1119528 RepID=UPI003F2D2CE5